MELTEKQIQFIENRLENDGVKYWDIRIEMLDHVVTDVENKLENGEKFKTAVQESFLSLGWKENFNGSNFEGIMQRKQNVFAKEYRKRYWKYFKNSIVKTSSLVLFLSFVTLLYTISFYSKIFKYTLFTYLISMSIFIFYFLIKYRVNRSIQLNNALEQAGFSLSIINFFIYMPKMIGIDVFKFPFLVAIVFGFVFLQSILGIQFFKKEYQKVNATYKQLIS
ncbi:hypothetical protein [Tenacibaculum aiptasiae]|uniref:hypothetical protein n=1 Tax=Tenacibaculum aiptasiae TaxID=426481 RepID=UPI003B58C2F7